MNQAGKNPRPRPYVPSKWDEGYQRINFRHSGDKVDNARLGKVVDGRQYLGCGCWKQVDHCDCELRDSKP